MFAFGSEGFDEPRCEGHPCHCICETSASDDGSCDLEDQNGYILYKYEKTNSYNYDIFWFDNFSFNTNRNY